MRIVSSTEQAHPRYCLRQVVKAAQALCLSWLAVSDSWLEEQAVFPHETSGTKLVVHRISRCFVVVLSYDDGFDMLTPDLCICKGGCRVYTRRDRCLPL